MISLTDQNSWVEPREGFVGHGYRGLKDSAASFQLAEVMDNLPWCLPIPFCFPLESFLQAFLVSILLIPGHIFLFWELQMTVETINHNMFDLLQLELCCSILGLLCGHHKTIKVWWMCSMLPYISWSLCELSAVTFSVLVYLFLLSFVF